MNKNRGLTPLAVVLMLSGSLALTGCDDKQAQQGGQQMPEVGVVTLKTEPLQITTELPGRTSAFRIAEVRPQVSGIILKRNFTEGGDIEAGVSLYQIDPATYQAAYESAKGDLAKAQAAANMDQLTVKRYQKLLGTKYISQQDYDTAVADAQQSPELWLRSFNGENWLYFNPESGEQGLPSDRVVWWTGDEPLVSIEGGKKPQVSFTLNNSEMNAIRLAKLTDENTDVDFLEYSLYGLPLQTQQTYQIMIMIPIGVLVILILRNLGGLQTLGTFTPVLIALAFRETQLGFGIVLFTIITALGLSLRSYLEHLKLQMLPRLSVVLTFVVVLIAVISLFSHKLGLERGLSVALFPMVILTMTIERLSITWEERGGSHAFKVAVGTLFAATLAHLLMTIPELTYFIFTFPAVLLIMVGFMLAMGRYRGYRLTELFRFKAFLKD